MPETLRQHRTPISHDQWRQVENIYQPRYKNNWNSYLTCSISYIKSETRARYQSFFQLPRRVQRWELTAVEAWIQESRGCNSCQSKHKLHQAPMNSLVDHSATLRKESKSYRSFFCLFVSKPTSPAWPVAHESFLNPMTSYPCDIQGVSSFLHNCFRL